MHLKNKKSAYLRIFIILFVSPLLFIAQDMRKSVDEQIENIFIKTRGELEPDTSIIIIHFTEEDIARIGPWPIKRNYYALLINQLSNLGVKKIGLEVFLSSRLVTQSVYDNLLLKEIEKSGKVVLSSLAGSIVERNNQFITDSLSYPSPKLLDETLLTGHINFNKDDGIHIPLEIKNFDLIEKAEKNGWITKTGNNRFAIAAHLPPEVLSRINAINSPEHLGAIAEKLYTENLIAGLDHEDILPLLDKAGWIKEARGGGPGETDISS